MVIEYVGEIIRHHVAEKREKVYEKQGVFSCLFNIRMRERGCRAKPVDEPMVV